MKGQAREHPIQQKFPSKVLNNTTVNTLGNTEQTIEVFPPEIFFKDIEANQNYEVTVTVRNISKRVRRIKFTKPKTSKFRIDYEAQGPIAAGLAIKLNVSFETDADGDFHDVIEIGCEDSKESYKLLIHATKPAADIQFEPLVNFKFVPVSSTKFEQIEFKNEGLVTGNIRLELLADANGKKSGDLSIEPKEFSLMPNEIKKVKVGLTALEPDFIMKLIKVGVEGQDRVRNIEVTATSVDHNLSIVFEEGGGQRSSLNFGTLYMGERREYPAFLVNNGPKPVPFNFKFLQGLRNVENEDGSATKAVQRPENLISPATHGKEQTDRVLTTEPLQGIVAAYSQVPLKFICRTKKYEKMGGFSDHSERTKPTGGALGGPSEEKYAIKPEEYASMALISFQGPDKDFDDLKVQMMARACYPDIKISRQAIAFGECPVNERRDYNLTIKNKNEDLPLDFNFTKVAQFHAMPAKGKLLPGTEHTINISYEPKNFGVFSNLTMDLELLGGLYKIPIKLQGSCIQAISKKEQTRGPAARSDDFSPTKNFVDEYQADAQPTNKSFKKTKTQGPGDIPRWLSETTTMGIDSDLKIDNTEKIDQLMVMRQNKTKYNDFIRTERLTREQTQRVVQKMKSTNRPPPQTLEDHKNDIDLGLEGGLVDMDPPHLAIPSQVDSLYVEKPIGDYEPYPNFKSRKRFGDGAENRLIKKKYKAEPTTQTELRECALELSGEQLQKINAGPQLIDFKNVFVKSTASKSFVVTNDLRQHIHVRLVITDKELMKTSPLSQVIPPGQEAGFDITFCSDSPQALTFKKEVTYFINDTIPFKFLVQAQAEPVSLDVSKKNLKFNFPDDCMDMSISETIVITNTGNATAKFVWGTNGSGIFVANPPFDEVGPGSSKITKITFKPPGPKSEEEILTLKIEDGMPVDIKCQGIVNEAKCQLKEKIVEFDSISVGVKAKEQTFHLKNQIRVPGVFNVQCDNEELTVTPSKGRIMADQLQAFNVTFFSNVEKDFNSEITINIRGARPIKVPVHARAMIPQVKIEQDILDFQGVTFGDAKILPMTLINNSNIDAKLVLDLRDFPEFEIFLPTESVDPEDITSEILVPISEATKPINYNDLDDVNPEDIKDPLNEDENEDEEDEEDEENNRYVQINVRAGKGPLKLNLKYTPADVDDARVFQLPLKLSGIGEIAGLIRSVKGVGVKPRFLVEPTSVNFKTKVIAKGSKPLPFHQDVTISNPDVSPISWSIDRDLLEKSKVFSMNPIEGKLDPGVSSSIRVTFNPLEPLEYITKIPVFVDNDRTKAYLMIEIRGEGQEAKIYFDRREIILPCVPLGFQAKCTFMVCHNGYENLELRPKIATEVGKLPITLNFPDGKNLGVTKQKIKVEAVFTNKKPLSFTTYVDFYDDEGNKFSIPISGTTDNSLFTVFSFIQRNQDEISLEFGVNKPITIIQDAGSDDESGPAKSPGGFGGAGGKAFSRAGGSSVISRNARSIIGFNPVGAQILERNCEQIVRWFNATLTTSSSMQSFPNDIISQNGSQIYDLVAFLAGKKPPGQAPKNFMSAKDANVKDTLKILMAQYEELINFLKVNGAHLNTVRPEYLLSISDYSKFLKLNPREENMKPKTIDRIFPYISMDAWMTVVYQVLRIYYLNRVTAKSFKALPGMPGSESNVDPAMQTSNIYSVSETVLLKWMQYHYNKMNPMHPKILSNFDADLQDGQVFAALIKSHYGVNSSKNLKEMRASVFNEEQVLLNAKKLIEAVHEIGLTTHLIPSDIANPSARELLLFVVQLYQGLPHYVPKAQIEFPAVLGDLVTKNIELSNPSKNPISYWVKLDGSSDFQIDEEQVRIEPGTTVNFPIKFQSRISNVVSGKVIFTNKKEGNIQAAAMVFELVSNVYERNSIEKIEKQTKLYKAAQIDIEVHNPFPQDVIFSIQILSDKAAAAASKAKKGDKTQQAPSTTGKKGGASELGSKISGTANKYGLPEPFTCKMETVKVRKNQTVNVPVLFLPFELGIHKCFVIFVDENVGELQYTLIGKAELPEVMDSFTDNCNAEETFTIRKALNFKNEKLEQARNQVLDKAALAKQKDIPAPQQFDGKGRPLGADQKYFEVEISHPSFSGTSNIILTQDQAAGGRGAPSNNPKEESKNKKDGVTPKAGGNTQSKGATSGLDVGVLNMFDLTVNPTKPATYPCFVILKSLDRTDIRLYEFKVNAIPQKIKAQLEFKVPARGTVTQEIPIVNNSQKEWTVSASLEQIKGGSFSLARNQITVKKGTTENFMLSFRPTWVCQITGMLTLNNKNTGEVYEYELKGTGEEPLAEDHIVLNCKARETTKYFFEIKNPSDKPQTYTCWTDLQNAVGKKEFILKPKETYKYELAITPLLGGVYTASITFQDNEERFMWWTVEVRTDSPKPESSIDLKAIIRKATSAEISLSNPLNEPITFEVFYSGEGLIGDATLSLEPKSIGTYSLIYSPLKTMISEGTIGFLNERVGEFWYDLHLAADENPVSNLETLACELGKLASHFVNLENPTGQEMTIEVKNSNATNFEVLPDKIVLAPYETQKVCIQYSPSNLDIVEAGNIIFENIHIGKWEYNVAGKGLLPTIMEPQPISTAVGNNTSSMLTFKNPFREASTVNVMIEAEDAKIFSLLLKRNKFNIGPLAILQIPYSFSPQTMTESKATIVISMSKQLVWRYPLRGIAESASTQIDYHFKTRARKPIEENIQINLPGVEEISSDDSFRYEINVQNPQFKGFVERSVFFEQKTELLRSAKDPLVFQMRFEPLRSFKSSLEFIVYKSSGGRWKFNMVFEAVDPEVDDVIVIQSPLQKTSSVSFKLTNHLKAFSEFTAFFTADSAAEFLVYPKTGLLEPYGKEGTNFIVSFTPTEYGKAKIGRLVIQTEEMQWTYEIRGSHPHYKIPEVGTGRIQNKLSKEVNDVIKQHHGEKKNFMRENLKTAKYIPVSQKEYSPSRQIGSLAGGGPSMANFSIKGGNKSRIGITNRELSNDRSMTK